MKVSCRKYFFVSLIFASIQFSILNSMDHFQKPNWKWWKSINGKMLRDKGKSFYYGHIALSFDGKYLAATTNSHGSVDLIDLQTSEVLYLSFPVVNESDLDHVNINVLSFSPDGNLLAFDCRWHRQIVVYNIQANQFLVFYPECKDTISSICFSLDGLYCACAFHGVDGLVKVFDMRSNKIVCEFDSCHSVASMWFNHDNEIVVTSNFELKTLSLKDGTCINTKKLLKDDKFHVDECDIGNINREAIAFSPCGEYVYIGFDDGRIGIYSLRENKLVQSFHSIRWIFRSKKPKAKHAISQICVSSNGSTLVSVRRDGHVDVWTIG